MKPVPTKREWAKRIGIGNVTYDRLATQASPPQGKTVRAVADAIGISYDEAAHMAGLIKTATGGDAGADLIYRDIDGNRVYVQVKYFSRPEAQKQVQALRKAGHETGRTLGDVLVLTGLAEPQELKLTRNFDVGEIEDDPDLPDEVKQLLLDGYRRLRAEVVETVRSHKGR